MNLPMDHLSRRVPRRLPIGAKYVVEGYGGEQGNLRVIARYLLLPDGHRINVPPDLSRPASPRALAFRRASEPSNPRPKADPHASAKNSPRPPEPGSNPGVN
jgi:hypothetical protein